MKSFSRIFLFLSLCSAHAFGQGLVADAVEKQALLDLYNATITNGPWVKPWNVTKLQDPTKVLADFTTTAVLPAVPDLPGVTIIGNDITIISLGYFNNVRGNIPASLAGLTQLKTLDIGSSSNSTYNQINGAVPNLSALTNLEFLAFNYNSFTGNLDWLTSLTKLVNLDLSHASGALTFNIATAAFGNWANLAQLNLSNISLTGGAFNSSVGLLDKLTHLQLGGCGLTSSSFPVEFGGMAILTSLGLPSNPIGNIPSCIGNLTTLTACYLSLCSLQSLPASFAQLDLLVYLDLSHNSLGNIPANFQSMIGILAGCNSLSSLLLQYNLLTDVPSNFNQLLPLRTLHLSNNPIAQSGMSNLSGSGVTYIQCVQCNLTTSLPSSFLSLPGLQSLYLSNNAISLSSPGVENVLKNIPTLRNLYAEFNSISGPLPSWVGSAYSNLWETLILSNNQIQSPIPPGFQSMTKLKTLYLANNSLTGSFPSYFGGFTALEYLQLQNNQLTSPLPDLSNCNALYDLHLGNNQFSGDIPSYFLTLTNFRYLDITNNSFANIPNLRSRPNGGSLQLRLGNNFFDFVDLEPFLSGPGIPSVGVLEYTPQKTTVIGDPVNFRAVEGLANFPISYSPGGTKNTYFWQRFTGGSWINLSSSYSSSNSYSIAPVNAASAGSYRVLVQNSWATGLTFTGNTIQIVLVPPLCQTPISVKAGAFKMDKLTGAIVFDRNDCTANIPLSCIYGPASGVDVVSAKAINYSDSWSYSYLGSTASTNPFLSGERGKWRTQASYVANVSISQSNDKNYNSGTFKYKPFNWKSGDKSDYPGWLLSSKVEKYSPHGDAVEERNAIGIPSTAKFGYSSAVPYLIAQNADYNSVLFESFENLYTGNKFEDGVAQNGSVRAIDFSHSGQGSLKITGASTVTVRDFIVTGQIKSNGLTTRMWIRGLAGVSPLFVATGAISKTINTQLISRSGEWALYDAALDPSDFTSATVNSSFTLKIQHTGAEIIWIDDLRIQPKDAELTAYVYDKNSLRLLTVFDDQHFGLFYQYNIEGKLMRKIIETERGLKTIQETQYNTPLVNKPN